jgi:uncharacterized YccA/Bax inhibitor family protein
LQTSNPALRSNPFLVKVGSQSGTMTISGTVNKTLICTCLLIASASFVWWKVFLAHEFSWASPFMIGGAIAGFIVAMVTIFKPAWSPYTAPLYCILEGLLIGGISSVMEASYPMIVIEACALTIGALLAMLLAYKFGLIKVTEKFRMGLTIAIGGIFLVYLVSIVLNLFHINMPYIHDSGPIGIGFSLVVIIIASLSLTLDFAAIEDGTRLNAPKYMEWYGAFSLMVTLIWLYLEILNLLAKINNRK